MSETLLIASIPVGIGVVRLVEVAVKAWFGRRTKRDELAAKVLTNGRNQNGVAAKVTLDEVSKNTDRLLEMHERYDGDGLPLWYFPRSIVQAQAQMVQTMEKISRTQEAMLDRIDDVKGRTVRLEERIDRLDDHLTAQAR